MRFLVFIFVFLVVSPALAETGSPYKGGLNYTAIRKQPVPAPAPAEPEESTGLIRHKTVIAQPEKTEEESPADKVWKKYKALAAGEYEEEPAQESADKKDPETAPAAGDKKQAAATSETAPPPKATGMAAIIEQYQQNKQQRSQMRSLHIPPQQEIHSLKEEQAAHPAPRQAAE